jgi:hypothetical protein
MTDLFVKVTFKTINSKFTNLFYDLWNPEEITENVFKVYVFDEEGFDQLQEFLDKEIGARNYQIVQI